MHLADLSVSEREGMLYFRIQSLSEFTHYPVCYEVNSVSNFFQAMDERFCSVGQLPESSSIVDVYWHGLGY